MVQADTLARFYRLCGDEVRFQTGTDENSIKNVQAADLARVPVGELVERNAAGFRALRESLDLFFDDFIRTSADFRHRPGVERLWSACLKSGDIYKHTYHGLYCTGCEQFYKPDELHNDRCPEHGTVPDEITRLEGSSIGSFVSFRCFRRIISGIGAASTRMTERYPTGVGPLAYGGNQIAARNSIVDADEVSYGLIKIDIIVDMTVDLKHLRYFLAVAEQRHITRAAEKLGMQQPPLSQRIKEIERQLNVQLFRRKARGIDLTDAGRVFLDNARTILADYERPLQSTRRAARGEMGELSVGIMPTAFFHPFVPSAIRHFRKDFPDVSVSLDECLRAEAFERIQNERMDVAFMRTTGYALEGLVIYPLLAEPMILAVPAAHELAQRDRGKSLSLRLAGHATFIVYARELGPVFFEATIAACRRAGFSPRIGQEAPLAVSALNLVSAGIGIAVVPRSMRRMSLDGVVYRDPKGEVPKAILSIAVRRNDPSNVVRNFLTMVRRRAKEANAKAE